ncbi:hypothetical protein T4B_14615 [Trichinella pseudospiralis]|uniref:Uncharacterized protein n=2 Tax=Trichinella pseudospiralis TaxID=6337 RepID=A0A0V1H7N8_TRIPS|nr:hypothetical protein T4E_9749 [Trichinella pseudospiralis]KRY70403.1 hypothetical protein T4A_12496 [Trichinella pseudospiralis]KRY84230.1 hypothetical protein T4D_9928 [Trichinella pseudospiralis]KRZ06196.1 hypothetical protein T4B_14615 [Trichinella pseudospiralis]KRZ34455.1 hypothetical protein T4C_5976 [Trichinella pseudospiralis]
MPSGKCETERKVKAPANTDLSRNSDGRANNLAEETDERLVTHPNRGIHEFTKNGMELILIR